MTNTSSPEAGPAAPRSLQSESTTTDALSPASAEIGTDYFAGSTVKVVLTFQGGGAKGIVHIGAYREIERAAKRERDAAYKHWPRYEIRAVTGTSIGAIFAALAAAGYTSEEMLESDVAIPGEPEARASQESIARRRRRPWINWLLFGRRATQRARRRSVILENAGLLSAMHVFGRLRANFYIFRWFIRRPLQVIGTVSAAWFLCVILLQSAQTASTLGVLAFSLLSILGFLWMARGLVGGLYSTKRLERAIDRALATKLVQHFKRLAEQSDADPASARRLGLLRPEDYRNLGNTCAAALDRSGGDYVPVVTFRMMRQARCRPLAIVATNITTNSLEVFSTDATPEEPVARAVAASSALPFLFQPVDMRRDSRTQYFFDGGLTSNLPAWSFDIARKFNPDLYTMTIEIPGDASRPAASWWRLSTWRVFRPFHDFRALSNAALFGARPLEKRRTRALSIEINPPVKLLDFDLRAESARTYVAYAQGGWTSGWRTRPRTISTISSVFAGSHEASLSITPIKPMLMRRESWSISQPGSMF